MFEFVFVFEFVFELKNCVVLLTALFERERNIYCEMQSEKLDVEIY